jgi:hypothetical protein
MRRQHLQQQQESKMETIYRAKLHGEIGDKEEQFFGSHW